MRLQAAVRQLPSSLIRPILLDHDLQVLLDGVLDGRRDILGKARGTAVQRGDLPGLMEGRLPGVRIVLVHRHRHQREQDAEEHPEGADDVPEDPIPLLGIVDDPAHDRPEPQHDQARHQTKPPTNTGSEIAKGRPVNQSTCGPPRERGRMLQRSERSRASA